MEKTETFSKKKMRLYGLDPTTIQVGLVETKAHVTAGVLGAHGGTVSELELAVLAHHAAGVPGAATLAPLAGPTVPTSWSPEGPFLAPLARPEALAPEAAPGLSLALQPRPAAPFPGPLPLRRAASRAGPRAAKARPSCVTRPAQASLLCSLHSCRPPIATILSATILPAVDR